jgi:predicted anti-sigma-YlaC factor YlaD
VNCERKLFFKTLSKGVDLKMQCKKARKNISLALDGRLETAVRKSLQGHLDICPSCRKWQQEQSFIQELFSAREVLKPSPGFYQKLQMKIDNPAPPARTFFIKPTVFRPAVLRAAMLLIMIVAALIGFSLGNRLDAPAAETVAAAFNQTMNLNTYADMPAESFGAVYDRLLQGELQ